ncbi:MAG TPA: replication initiation and membrane attachment protein [Firmicutes bacterium]|nr:replication initiation and membrane attachment protein [Bacillota bacterium]
MTSLVIKPNTPFELVGGYVLSFEKMQILTLGYQPVIGMEAMSLYMTLNALSRKKMPARLEHQMLMQLLHVKIEALLTSRQKLEAVGLIQTYYDESTQALSYKLNKPLNGTQFFNDGIINVFLSLQVGPVEYQLIKQLIVDEDELLPGKNISTPFNEMFDTSVLARQTNATDHRLVKPSPGAKIVVNDSFDKELLLTLLKQNGMKEGNLSDKMLDQINKLAFLYKLNEHELARLIFDALDPDGFVNYELFKKLAKQHFQFLNKGKPVQMVEVQGGKDGYPQMESSTIQTNSKQEKLIQGLTQTNPIDFLKAKSNQKDPVPADRQLVEWLVVEQQLPWGVVNVLIDYVLKVSDGRLGKAFVEKIAGEWQRKNIDTTEKAIAHVKSLMQAKTKKETQPQAYAKPTKGYARPAIRVEMVPDWLKDNDNTVQSEQSLSEADLNKIEEMKKLQESILQGKG